jgi:hypothetical protein
MRSQQHSERAASLAAAPAASGRRVVFAVAPPRSGAAGARVADASPPGPAGGRRRSGGDARNGVADAPARAAVAPQRGVRGAAVAPAGEPDACDISALVQPLVEEVQQLQARLLSRVCLRQRAGQCALRVGLR